MSHQQVAFTSCVLQFLHTQICLFPQLVPTSIPSSHSHSYVLSDCNEFQTILLRYV